ncbi:MAG: hypothetical protein ACI4UV_08470 [Victivallales bacterium]
MNKEQISIPEMNELARKSNPAKFDADKLCRLSVDGGMKYAF